MRFARTSIAFLALASLYLSVNPAAVVQGANTVSTAADFPRQGETAPTFSLPSQSGKTVSLAQFHGKWVVLYFYPEDMTAGCTIEAHGFQRDAEKFRARNAVIVGVSVDSIDSHKAFCAKEGLDITLLSDTGRTVVTKYGSLNAASNMANRNTFLISPEGKIAKVWTKVSPVHHSEEVIAALDAETAPAVTQ
jgi:thioredoxin-dependent peroxiredoxin